MDYTTIQLPIIEARPDWITCTGRTEGAAYELAVLGTDQTDAEERAGNKLEPWRFQNYRGFQAGNWRWGWGKDGSIVVVSGIQAEIAASRLAHLADHWSRIDYCVTVLDVDERISPDEDYWQEADRIEKAGSTAPSLARIQERKRGATLSYGDRASAYFARVYNKHAESPSEYPRGCWRWELELKRHASEQHQRRWRDKPMAGQDVLNLISTEFERNKLSVPWTRNANFLREPVVSHHTDADRILRWLERQVKPSVQFAAQARGREKVMEVLDL